MAADLDAAIDAVRERVAVAAARAGRRPDEIRIVAVAKTHPPEAIAAAVARGLVDIGENRVQELLDKQRTLRGLPIRWHVVGMLQRNKVRLVVGRVAMIHSVDSAELAREIGTRATRAGTTQDVLLEVNVAGESSKHGVPLDEARDAASEVAGTEGLRLRGFMTMPPQGDADSARAAFAALRDLRDETVRDVETATELSMGMSGDLEIAVEEGATMVRVGTAIFGARETQR